MKLLSLLSGVGLLLGLLGSAAAEQYVDTGEYVIHYNAFPTEALAPQVARAYGITRAENRAMLNVTIMKKQPEGLDVPVEGKVEATAINLTGQLRELDMRLISEQNARYYVGFVRVSSEETLNFKVLVTPEGSSEPIEISFGHRFSS